MAALTGAMKDWDFFYKRTQKCLNPVAKGNFEKTPDTWFTINDLNADAREGWISDYRLNWDRLATAVGKAADPILRAVYAKLPISPSAAAKKSKITQELILDLTVQEFRRGASSQMMMDSLQQLASLFKPSDVKKPDNIVPETSDFVSFFKEMGVTNDEEISQVASNMCNIIKSPEYQAWLNPGAAPNQKESKTVRQRQEARVTKALTEGAKANQQALDMLENDPEALLKFYNFCALSLNGSLSSDLSVEKRRLLWRKFCEKSKPLEVSSKAEAAYAELMASEPSKAQKSEKKFSRPKSKAGAPVLLPKPSPAASASSSAAEEPVLSLSPKQLKWLSLLNQPHDPRRHPLAPRITRWREGPSIQEVRSFVDRDPATGNTLQKYLECTDEQIHDLIAAHNLPMERILAIPDLQSAYSVPYTFLNAEGKRHQGRCFYAKIDFGGLESKGGVIRVAVDAQGAIYHIFFEERQAMQFAECTQTVPDTSALDSETPFQQVATYAFEFENDTIVINIAGTKPEDKPIVVKIPNLLH